MVWQGATFILPGLREEVSLVLLKDLKVAVGVVKRHACYLEQIPSSGKTVLGGYWYRSDVALCMASPKTQMTTHGVFFL